MADGVDRYLKGTLLDPDLSLNGKLSGDTGGLTGELSSEVGGLTGTLTEGVSSLKGALSTDQNGLVGELSGVLSNLTGTLDGEKLRGYSAYDIACEEGFVGTKAEWLKSLKGDKGAEGPRGYGIARAWLNTNGTLSLQYENGNTFTTSRSIVPLKGVDYFTKADVNEIVEEVLRRIGQ